MMPQALMQMKITNMETNDMVEWKKLDEVCTYYRGVTYNKKQEVPLGTGGTKILRANNITLDSNTLNFEDIKEVSSDVKIKEYQWLNPNDILICAGSGSKEHVGKVAFIFEKIGYAYGGFMGKLVVSEGLQSRFLFHVLSSHLFKKYLEVALNSTTINNLNAEIVNNFLIPVPSITEQTRIVGILDTFTASIENLKQQIAQRRKQYEHYRDQLLDLEGKEGVEMMRLEELFTFKNGLNKSKEFFGTGKPIIMFTNVFNSRSINASLIKSRVNVTDKELERINACVGDVFFTRTSETKEDVGYASVLIEDVGECTFSGFLIRARPITNKFLPNYCKYCFSTPKIRESIVNKSSFTTRASLTGGGLGSVVIPVPSLSEQQRIVSILDTFESSIANLERQLAQRERQYEYYRNKLLTFE